MPWSYARRQPKIIFSLPPLMDTMVEYRAMIDIIKEFGVVWANPGEEFVLASGAKSKFYIDFSRVMMVPLGAMAVVNGIASHLGTLKYDLIGGPSSGADPIVGAFLTRGNISIRGFTIRKEPKGRGPGAGDMYEGYLRPGLKAVVVEDVTTSGNSVLKAINIIEGLGVKVVKVVSLLDRQAGADKALAGYDFASLVKLDELELPV